MKYTWFFKKHNKEIENSKNLKAQKPPALCHLLRIVYIDIMQSYFHTGTKTQPSKICVKYFSEFQVFYELRGKKALHKPKFGVREVCKSRARCDWQPWMFFSRRIAQLYIIDRYFNTYFLLLKTDIYIDVGHKWKHLQIVTGDSNGLSQS